MVEHAQVVRLFGATTGWYQFNENDTFVLTHSFSFDVSVWEMWGAFFHGGKLIIPSHHTIQSPEGMYRLICNEGVTVLNMTPSAFRPIIRVHSEMQLTDKLRFIVLAGEALEPAILRSWYALRSEDSPKIINMYGPTETTVYATYRVMTAEDCNLSISPIGSRLPDLTLYVLDSHGRPVPLGAIGELCIGGLGVTRGYLNRPELTSEKFPLDPFSDIDGARIYKTGDLARFLPNGELIYLGRNDHQVKIRGFRIELGEIEARLMDHKLVRESLVLAVGSDEDKRLVAYVVVDTAEGLAQQLRDHLAPLLPDYMVPAAFVRMDRFPLTPNGKLDRRALPEPDREAFVNQGFVAPLGQTEVALAAIWADLLKVDQVGRFDNFFMLGGNSLLAVKMIGQVRANLGSELKLHILFGMPTIAMLAAELSRSNSGGSQENLLGVLVPFRAQGNRTPLFCVHAVLGFSWYYMRLLEHVAIDQPIYGIQARGLDGVGLLADSMDSMAADYIGEIRKVQPHGPYQLLGWSLGGNVVHTMASMLTKMGEKVDLLAVMDAIPDLATTAGEKEENDEEIEERSRPVEAHFRYDSDQQSTMMEMVDEGTLLGKVQYMLKKQVEMANNSERIDLAEVGGLYLTEKENKVILNQFMPVRKNNMRLREQYSASTFTGNMIYFLAVVPTDEGASISNPQMWKPFVEGAIEVYEVESKHDDMYQKAPMEVVGRTLATKLEELHKRRNPAE
ncbi:hypothetical protein BGX26_003378 [Mortierella sp. AD094]|nr:hypothetical protein BGX26_003378 [Mortierella sp. AD094]